MGSKQRWFLVSLLCFGMVSISMEIKGSIYQNQSIEIIKVDYKYNWIHGTEVEGLTTVAWSTKAYYEIEIAIANVQEKSLELRQINLSVYAVEYSSRFVRWNVIKDELPIILAPNKYCTFLFETGSEEYTFRQIYVNVDGEWLEFYLNHLEYSWPTQWSNIYHYTHTSIMTLPTIILGLLLGGWIIRQRRKKQKGNLQT